MWQTSSVLQPAIALFICRHWCKNAASIKKKKTILQLWSEEPIMNWCSWTFLRWSV